MTEPFGRLQFWLQGWPDKQRPWLSVWLGNRISSARYWVWRAWGHWDGEL
jgi:hypothetical protein